MGHPHHHKEEVKETDRSTKLTLDFSCKEPKPDANFFDMFLHGIGGIQKYPDGLEDMGLTEDSPIGEFAEKAMWGTYGKPRKATMEWKRLRDLSTEHLEMILITQRQISYAYTQTILFILRQRRRGILGTIKRRVGSVLNAF